MHFWDLDSWFIVIELDRFKILDRVVTGIPEKTITHKFKIKRIGLKLRAKTLNGADQFFGGAKSELLNAIVRIKGGKIAFFNFKRGEWVTTDVRETVLTSVIVATF